jgi:GAF domain-containing protein
MIPARVFAFYQYDTDKDVLRCAEAIGDSHGLLSGIVIRPAERVTGWSAANLRTSVNSNAALDLLNIAGMFDPPLRSTLCTPVTLNGNLVGVLTAYATQADIFTDDHRYAIEQVSVSLAQHVSTTKDSSQTNIIRFAH